MADRLALYGSAALQQPASAASQEQHNILPLSVSQGRFPLLPLSMQTSARASAAANAPPIIQPPKVKVCTSFLFIVSFWIRDAIVEDYNDRVSDEGLRGGWLANWLITERNTELLCSCIQLTSSDMRAHGLIERKKRKRTKENKKTRTHTRLNGL